MTNRVFTPALSQPVLDSIPEGTVFKYVNSGSDQVYIKGYSHDNGKLHATSLLDGRVYTPSPKAPVVVLPHVTVDAQ